MFCKLATVSKIKEMVVGTFFKTKHSLDLSYTNVDTRYGRREVWGGGGGRRGEGGLYTGSHTVTFP